MKTSIKKIKEFYGENFFVKYTNTNDFPELSSALRDFLKNEGMLSKPSIYPETLVDGKLIKIDSELIQFAIASINLSYCIDISQNERIVCIDLDDKERDVVNSSFYNFLECKYIMSYYYRDIEFKKKYGTYAKNKLKYVGVLRDMLNEVEHHIDQYPAWHDELFQKELGVI